MPEAGEPSFFGRFDASIKPIETAPIRTELVFIDQTSQFQPYVKHGELNRFLDFRGLSGSGMIPASEEGFSHNEDRQRFVGDTLAKLFSFQNRGKELLEVGYGTNHFVAESIAKAAKTPVCLLDYIVGYDEIPSQTRQYNPPKKIAPLTQELPRYVGDMAGIDIPGSALKNHSFAGILYNGSWVSSGNNWTVMETEEGKYAKVLGTQPDWNSPEFRQYRDRQVDTLLQVSKNHLSPNGVLFIASSRYAYHGAGYDFSKLPDEKIEFLDVIRRLKHMGAKKITVIGLGSTELLRMYRRNLENPEFKNIRTRVAFENLFIKDVFKQNTRYELSDKNGVPIPNDELKRIASTPEQLNHMIAHSPAIHDKVQEELHAQQAHGQSILNQLMGGLESLPQSIQYSTVDPETITRIKNDLHGFIDSKIGRIDAIAAEF